LPDVEVGYIARFIAKFVNIIIIDTHMHARWLLVILLIVTAAGDTE